MFFFFHEIFFLFSLIKSPVGKGTDFRRPATADSAKTSNVDSDDNFEEDVSD